MQPSRIRNPQQCRNETVQSIAAPSSSSIRDGFAEVFWRAFRGPYMAKRASQAARCNPKTPERWASGQTTPLFEQVILLCAADDEFARGMQQLIQDVREGRRR